jgi:hypothetical protein
MITGRYPSEDDLLREALRVLKQRDEEVLAIQEGIADMEAGRVRYVLDFDREFRARSSKYQCFVKARSWSYRRWALSSRPRPPVWPRAKITVAWDNAPGMEAPLATFWP